MYFRYKKLSVETIAKCTLKSRLLFSAQPSKMEEVFRGFEEDAVTTEEKEEFEILNCGAKHFKLLHNGFIYHRDKQVC